MALDAVTIFSIAFLALSDVTAFPSLTVTNIITETTPSRANISFKIVEVDDDQLVNVNITFLKRLNHQLMVKFKLLKIEGKMAKKIFQAPKFNYCVLRRAGGSIPVLSELLSALESFGNLIFRCPAEPGSYSINDFSMDKLPLLGFVSTGSYLMHAEMIDENLKGRPELIMRFKVYMSRK